MKALAQALFGLFGLQVVRKRRFDSGAVASVQSFVKALQLPPGAVCFDVGANTGQTIAALLDSASDPSIHAFEPTDGPFTELQAKYGSDPRVQLVKAGASSRTGQATININSHSLLNSLHPANEASSFTQGSVIGHEPIELVTLDSYCRTQGIERIDVLKIDVQGHEPDVLRGAKRLIQSGAIDWIIAEVQFGDFYATGGDDLERVMAALQRRYSVFAIIDPTYIGKTGAISHADFVFRRASA